MKIIQILSTEPGEAGLPPTIYGLGDDGKLYYLAQRIGVDPKTTKVSAVGTPWWVDCKVAYPAADPDLAA